MKTKEQNRAELVNSARNIWEMEANPLTISIAKFQAYDKLINDILSDKITTLHEIRKRLVEL